jgi:hypothetical protein
MFNICKHAYVRLILRESGKYFILSLEKNFRKISIQKKC